MCTTSVKQAASKTPGMTTDVTLSRGPFKWVNLWTACSCFCMSKTLSGAPKSWAIWKSWKWTAVQAKQPINATLTKPFSSMYYKGDFKIYCRLSRLFVIKEQPGPNAELCIGKYVQNGLRREEMNPTLPPAWIMVLLHLCVSLALYVIPNWASKELEDPERLLTNYLPPIPWMGAEEPACTIFPESKPLGWKWYPTMVGWTIVIEGTWISSVRRIVNWALLQP